MLEAETKEYWTKKVTLDPNNIDRSCYPLGFGNNSHLVLTYSSNKNIYSIILRRLRQQKWLRVIVFGLFVHCS